MMKQFGKRVAAAMMAAAMMAGTSAVAGAAGDGRIYDVTVEGKELLFSVGGRQTASYDMKTTDVKVTRDEDEDLLICYTNKKGKYVGLSLGAQKTLNIGGTIETLTLGNPLEGKVAVTVPAGSDIDRMVVYTKGNVAIEGDVAYLTVNAPARVTVDGEAEILRARLNDEAATLTAGDDAKVREAEAAIRRNLMGGGIQEKSVISEEENGDYRVRFDIDGPITYYVRDRDETVYLDDLDEDDLSMYVDVYGYDDDDKKRHLSGDFTWANPHQIIYDSRSPESDTVSVRFEFTPSSSEYEKKTGAIKIDVVYR